MTYAEAAKKREVAPGIYAAFQMTGRFPFRWMECKLYRIAYRVLGFHIYREVFREDVKYLVNRRGTAQAYTMTDEDVIPAAIKTALKRLQEQEDGEMHDFGPVFPSPRIEQADRDGWSKSHIDADKEP